MTPQITQNKHFKALFSLLFVGLFSSCLSTKNTIDFERVKSGKDLENSIEISVENFFQVWMNNRYPQKIDLNCHYLYKDKTYSYFGETTLKGLSVKQLLYKVQNDSLIEKFPNYRNIDGQLIRNEFWEQIIPKADKEKRQNSDCTSSSSNPKFSYQLVNNKIKISLRWIYKCDMKKIIDKSYSAYYDMEQLKFKE